MSLRYVMLELSGVCARDCALCLPKHLKTNAHMDIVRLTSLVEEMRAMGVQNVTLAGFGEPLAHPDFDDARDLLTGYFNVTITCRVQDLGMVWPINRANVSIDSVLDAKMLVELVRQHVRSALPTRLVPHIVLTPPAVERIETILAVLWAWEQHWERISIATPVALCGDAKHREAVAKVTRNSRHVWTRVKTAISTLGIPREKITQADSFPRIEMCDWPGTGVLINATFDLLPCCNLPVTTPLGNVAERSLQEAYNGQMWRHFREHYKDDPRCRACPDIGHNLGRHHHA